MSIPKFRDVVEVEWRHNDFTMQAEVTASYIVRTRSCIADEESTAEKCQWLEDKTIRDLRNFVHESATEEAHELPDELGGACCDSCRAYYEGRIFMPDGSKEFRYCPGCGRRLIRL